jgi:hypothetical protein
LAGEQTDNTILLAIIIKRFITYFSYENIFMRLQCILPEYFIIGPKPFRAQIAPFFEAIKNRYFMIFFNDGRKKQLGRKAGIYVIDLVPFGIIIKLYNGNACYFAGKCQWYAACRYTNIVFIVSHKTQKSKCAFDIAIPQYRPPGAMAASYWYGIKPRIFRFNNVGQFASLQVANGYVPVFGPQLI